VFQTIFTLFEEACHRLDLMLASHHEPEQLGSYNVYVAALQELTKSREDLNVAANLEQLVVYFSITLGQTIPLLQGLVQQSAQTKKSVEQLVISFELLQQTKSLCTCRKLGSKY
jgi:hypothetical protein